MTIAADYKSSDGKFPSAYGNVALVSCLNLLDWFFEWAEFTVAPTIEGPIKRAAWILALNNLQNDLAAKNVTWCDFAYEIDGVLTNQASYYID